MDRKQSYIGSYPFDWSLSVFDTVAELKHGYQFRTHDFTDEGIKIFKITQIKNDGTIDISNCDFIEAKRLESFKKFIIAKGDILMALSGATIGKIARFNSNEVVLQNYRVGNFIPLDEKVLSKDYFYYFLTTDYTYQQIIANLTQSAQENIGKEDIHKMVLFLPPLSEQTAIAEVLSSLDDKIDLLHRQNKTLDQLAETLFRQWFVEESDEGWEEATIRDIADHVKESINPSKSPDTIYHHFSLPAFDDGKVPKAEIGKEILSNKYKVVANSILISKLNPRFPRIWELYGDSVPENAICSTEFQIIKPKDIKMFGFIYCFLKSTQVTQELANAAGGTSGSHQRINPDDIFNLAFQVPRNNLIEKFDLITKEHFQKIKYNSQQIQTLTKLRETLLPKLMSGEVRLNQ
ncbi:MAG: restriction endonuclease subunit S [Chitinophagaceae bacterium]